MSKIFKLLLALGFLFVTINITAARTSAEIEADVNGCIASTQVSKELAEKLLKKGEFTDDPNFKCFIKCVSVKVGTMKETGELIIENLKKGMAEDGLPLDKATQFIDTCKNSLGTDPCEIAYKFSKCVMDEALKSYKS